MQARALVAGLLKERTAAAPCAADIEMALRSLVTLHPRDAYDEAALHETGLLLLQLRDAAGRGPSPS